MENKFNHEDFEHFLKENADQYRMFPSEKVWKGIHQTIHSRPKWYGIGLSLLILTTSVVTWVMLSNSNRNRPVITSLPPVTTQQITAANEDLKEPAVPVVLAPVTPANNKLAFITSNEKLQKDLYINNKESEVLTASTEEYVAPVALTMMSEPSSSVSATMPVMKNETITVQEQITTKLPSAPKPAIEKAPVVTAVNVVSIETEKPIMNEVTVPPATKEIASAKIEPLWNKVNDLPWTIESVINSYKHQRNLSKLKWSFYVTPTVTYRELNENKAFINWVMSQNNGFNNVTYDADINNIVKHKPDLGLQLGLNTGLPLSQRVRLIGGLQFNVSKYDIRAYTTPAEPAVVSLSTAAGRMNTLTATSYYRNVGTTTKMDWLRNLYISASIPVGLEWTLLGNRRNYFGVAGTMQPTYIMTNKSYLLTTDYKNYAKFPSLTRKINVNAGFEMFAGFTAGNIKMRVGPQVRYQVMSSYQDRYPISEHLFDFGFKMGFTLNK